MISAQPLPRVAPMIVVAPTPVVATPDPEPVENQHDDGDGTDVAAVLASLNEQVAAAARPHGEVHGRVTDEHDQPAIGCTVVALSPNLVGEQVVITDEHGDYDIIGLPPGYYSLTLYYNDHVFVRSDIALREVEPTHFDTALSSPPPEVEPEQEITIVDGVGITFSGSVAIEGAYGFE